MVKKAHFKCVSGRDHTGEQVDAQTKLKAWAFATVNQGSERVSQYFIKLIFQILLSNKKHSKLYQKLQWMTVWLCAVSIII